MHDRSIAEFEAVARTVLARLPQMFRDQLADIVLRVDDFAAPEQLARVGIADRWELTGLYEGVALPDRSQWDHEVMPPVITLFRQPLLAEMAQTGITFEALVRHVVIHEAGHHFGLSDADMHALEDSAGE